MYDTIVAIDLETTGIDPYKDHILEVGAAVYQDGRIIDTFDELVRVPVSLSPGIIKLTGITPSMLDDARPVDAVLADFLEFMPDDVVCIAHNAMFDRGFLRRATRDRFYHTVLDTVGLSRICFPQLSSHSLTVLREVLNLPRSSSHRALADCETLLHLWDKLLEQIHRIPPAVVDQLNELLRNNQRHPYQRFFQHLGAEIMTRDFGKTRTSLEDLFKPEIRYSPPREIPDDSEPPEKLDPIEIAGRFGPDGAFARKLDGFEHRPEQVEMAGAVVEAFNDKRHLLVEAGTGIGKSLAYLVPAVTWAVTNNQPVVISTNTKNLQAQLFHKDLPLVAEVLGVPFKTALIKGRGNYLCLRKLFYVLSHAEQELDSEERMRMLNILPWAAWSDTGDISENIVWERPGFYALWAKLSTLGTDCMGKGCRYFRKCFLQKARQRAQLADVVVANHSLVFAELGRKSPALPAYAQVIFDEAHNLEAAATSHLSVELSQTRIEYALGRLLRSRRKGRETGLIPSIMFQLQAADANISRELRDQALEHAGTIVEAVEAVRPAISAFFNQLHNLLAAAKKGASIRIDAERKLESIWQPIMDAKEEMLSALARVMRGIEALAESIQLMEPESMPMQRDFRRDLEANVTWLREISQDLEFVLEASDKDYVYWAERASPKHGGVRAWAAPVKVGPLLFDQVYQRRQSVIFSSATMTVRGEFDFIKKRLGIDLIERERLLEMNLGTPFDYDHQCKVVVPTFLPEPGDQGRDYVQELGILLSEIFRRTRGRGMVLFTSHDMLRRTAAILQDEMLGDGISILGQGISGSRENITATFKRDVHSVLLGTHSFWEGVDVVGETLSCLVLARLPFAVFTEPITQARCEQIEAEGGNAFLGYSLPNAVIRFRQGFGRLIRHKTDRGIVIIADRRMVAKRYGKWFQQSLPTDTLVFAGREELLDTVEEFL